MRKQRRFITQISQKQAVQSTFSTIEDSKKAVLHPLFTKKAINFYKRSSNIALPIETCQDKEGTPSNQVQMKKFPGRPKPPRNNLRCLNDFLKQQAFYNINKERIVSNSSSKQIHSSSFENMREKLVKMIKLQTTQSQIQLQQNALECFKGVHITNFQLECQPFREKQPKEKHIKLKMHSSIAKDPNDFKAKKHRLQSLTPFMHSPNISKTGSRQQLNKVQKMKSTSIRQTAFSKNNSLLKCNQQTKISCPIIQIAFDQNTK